MKASFHSHGGTANNSNRRPKYNNICKYAIKAQMSLIDTNGSVDPVHKGPAGEEPDGA